MTTRVWHYRGYEIEQQPTGWFSIYVSGYGWLKADTLAGAYSMIDAHLGDR